MLKSKKASLSIIRIACIVIVLVALLGVGIFTSKLSLKNVTIVLANNYEMNVLTTKKTISEILEENHIVLLPEENVVPSLDAELTDEKTITITNNNKEEKEEISLAKTSEEVTMDELLQEYTSAVTEKIITEEQEIPFETVTQGDTRGTETKVVQNGEKGIKEITYSAKYKDNEEIEKNVVEEKVVKEPINQIVEKVQVAKVTSRSASERVATSNVDIASASSAIAKKVQGKTPVVKNFNTSAYCACVKCCGKSNGITASGAKATAWHTVAAGSGYPIGTIIYIPALKDKPNGGWFVVQDRGGAISNSKLDIYMGSHSQAIQFGRKTLECYVYYM